MFAQNWQKLKSPKLGPKALLRNNARVLAQVHGSEWHSNAGSEGRSGERISKCQRIETERNPWARGRTPDTERTRCAQA